MAVKPDRAVGATPRARLEALLEICACPDCQSNLAIGREGGFQCTNCGRAFENRGSIPILLPRSSDATDKRYLANYDAIATADLAKPMEGNRQARHQKLKEFIGPVADKRVLDIGSSDATYLRQMDGRVRVALDIAVEYLEQIPAASGVLGICGDAEHLPIKAGFFDVVIISDVLEHVLHPERVVSHLQRICRTDTRLIVHVPWEEDLSQYRDSTYEFTHLRSFNSYNFGTLFESFYERRSRGTYPYLTGPLPYPLYGRLPHPLYNWMVFVFNMRPHLRKMAYRWWETWIAELPRHERWLLTLYRPLFRMFELRPLRGTLRFRALTWARHRRSRAKK